MTEYTLSDFDYDLPAELIAQAPAHRREASRLLHVCRTTGEMAHRGFVDLPELLREGDLLVLNDTRVIPARFFCQRESGAAIEGLYVQPASEDGEWIVLLKNAKRCKVGEQICFTSPDGDPVEGLALELRERLGAGRWRVAPNPPGEAEGILATVGITPLPPYIRRDDGTHDDDPSRYQTVYAREPGAVAAPTAGLHFTDEIFAQLAERNITTARVTLHVGLGTFEPVKVEALTEHDMHREWYSVTPQAAEAINAANDDPNRRVVAVGTTSVRVCESVARKHDGRMVAGADWTKLFLYPPADFHVIDALVTNFHLPKSTLLMLVSALCEPGGHGGVERMRAAYREAIAQRYRFFSYGDAMLIE
ncbi:MAG: tRNA preQ1(34) S-adenosylmethionine ribosyltransferase-isomerase QueA [Phycisphaerales bacterium]|jgi:S-adenosylmethionine:tRNA ribosyltransferase-isomerase|nr:tRNA preQ1(34) S-adenosylmethionine ribosyltransferase-isomerase QueA [Phycisphaerales bacterium]MBT7171509.1 tRNA preQ1(34) S-adenosylmethionine ribosyltransferase-isomerase QueA [Phycisphaerales bacterium]